MSQAIVFALDGQTGATDFAAVDEARAAAAGAIVVLDTSGQASADVASAVAEFRSEALKTTEELAVGEIATARARYGNELAAARAVFNDVVESRTREIDVDLDAAEKSIDLASILSIVAGLLAIVGAVGMSLLATKQRRLRVDGSELAPELPAATPATGTEARSHIVVQLPTGPNMLTRRRRYPKVEDLGWLIGEVMRPYEARGWETSLRCPIVGVDCDPADVREMLATLLIRADKGNADRIGVVIKPTPTRVQVIVADDGLSIFGPESYLSASEPVRLRSSVRTRTEADTAELTWSRVPGVNLAVLDLPRLGIVLPIGADA